MPPELDEAVQHMFNRTQHLSVLRHSKLLLPDILTQRDVYGLMIFDTEIAKFQDDAQMIREATQKDG